jgi:hypothetical protein
MPKINIDFTNVEDGFSLPSEGEKICKVKAITLEEGTKAKYLKWQLIIGTGPDKGSSIFHNTTLSPAGLFNLRNTLTALGVAVPKSIMQINTDAYIGKIIGVTVSHREYEKDGQKKKAAQVAELFQVVKGERGWVRAEQKVKDDLTNNFAAQQEVEDELDDADEIDI